MTLELEQSSLKLRESIQNAENERPFTPGLSNKNS